MDWTEEERLHIESTADDSGIDYMTAYLLADLLGRSELYDGFVNSIQDAEMFL